MKEKFLQVLENKGFEIDKISQTINGVEIIEGSRPVGYSGISIMIGDNGCIRIDKPNNTHKWYYDKTPAQLNSILNQIIDFYGFSDIE